MKATITYCAPCRYQGEALTAADTLLTLGVASVELVKGDNGVFNVAVADDAHQVFYTKHLGAPFPTYENLAALVRQAKSDA